jgi:hypothetical protein
MGAPIIQSNETPIALLAPGDGKTRTAAYSRLARRADVQSSPRFYGVIQADALSGCEALARSVE